MKIVLASTSEYKNNVLDFVHIKHSRIDSDFDEDSVYNENVYEYVKQLALGKANSVKEKVRDSIIIGLDTVVYVDGIILEKPQTITDAKKAIQMCKNNTASVITGICIINQKTNEIINEYVETKVSLRDIEDVDIEYYLKNEPGVMYSSGFVIETVMSNFIEKIDGSFYNILGIPVETIYKHINKMGYNLKDLEE